MVLRSNRLGWFLWPVVGHVESVGRGVHTRVLGELLPRPGVARARLVRAGRWSAVSGNCLLVIQGLRPGLLGFNGLLRDVRLDGLPSTVLLNQPFFGGDLVRLAGWLS
uniref:(northern house mosquito) hypothetical protein n=1 Tax=Culex pipiens TaxID=7175 RepID=A0A8D8CB19_CULPI